MSSEMPKYLSRVKYRNGEPCDHKGCLLHASRPCEGCGRRMAMGEVLYPVAELRALADWDEHQEKIMPLNGGNEKR